MTDPEIFKGPDKPHPSNIDCPIDRSGNAYLHKLCDAGAPAYLIREAVLKLGADINARNDLYQTPLALAIASGAAEAVETLVALGAPLYDNRDAAHPFNAVMLCVRIGRRDMFDQIVRLGGAEHINKSGINVQGIDDRQTCLHAALGARLHSWIDDMVKLGAYLERPTGPAQTTPLQHAAMLGDGVSIKKLMILGARIDNNEGSGKMTPLHHAAYNNHYNATEILIAAGADINAQTATSLTPLMYAAHNGNSLMVEMLLRAGARVDEKQSTIHDDTALLKAARKGDEATVRTLLDHGANPLLRDTFNKTAAQYARECKNFTIAALLQEREERAHRDELDRAYRKHRPQ